MRPGIEEHDSVAQQQRTRPHHHHKVAAHSDRRTPATPAGAQDSQAAPRTADADRAAARARPAAAPTPARSVTSEVGPTDSEPTSGDPDAATNLPAEGSVGRAGFFRSFVYAWHGLVYVVRTQRNARVHLAIGAAAIVLGILLRISPVEFALVFVASTLVFVAEMFNTVAEACVDLITDQYHPLAKIAKDVSAGAVLLNAMLSVVIGCFVFIPHLWPLVLRWLGR